MTYAIQFSVSCSQNERSQQQVLCDQQLFSLQPSLHLSIKGLSLAYGDRQVLSDILLPVYRGKITALIGPSGCGKSSFLSALNRLTDLNYQAKVSGSIELDGLDVLSKSVDALSVRRRIGMIFQQPTPFPLSIRRNLDLPLKEQGVRSKAIRKQKIEKALRDVGLWSEVCDRLDDSALSLSGGQQQRLCIARAIVIEPEVLLMDEPCSALDPMATEVVEGLIRRLSQAYTVLIVTHNLAQAKRLSDYTAFFWSDSGVGRLVEFAQTERLFRKPQAALTAEYISSHTV